MEGNFRHRCVAGAFSLVTFFWAPKESDKTKGRDQMQNVKEKMRNLKLAAVHFWSVRCVENPGISGLNGRRTLPARVPASADGPLRHWPEWSGRTEYCLSLT